MEISSIKQKCMSKTSGDSAEQIEEQERIEEYGKGGYHFVRIGDGFCSDRYQAIRKLGWGAFSTVWLCSDNQTDDYVAIKFVKSKSCYREAAIEEIKMLSDIQSTEDRDQFANRVVTLLNHFKIDSMNGLHYCLVFEVMGESLFKFQTTYYDRGIPIECVKRLSRQVLEGLVFLHTKCRLIHTDIKPENILLVINKSRVIEMHSEVANLVLIHEESQLPDSFVSMAIRGDGVEQKRSDCLEAIKNYLKFESYLQKSLNNISLERFDENLNEISIKIADLGNACNVKDYKNYTIQTRPYRSPEVIMGSTFGPSADIWSTACMIFELATGEAIFDYYFEHKDKSFDKNQNQLMRIIEILGPIPKNCRKGRHYSKYFSKSGRLLHLKEKKQISLLTVLMELYDWDQTTAQSFADFLLPMLEIDPKKRASASVCLSHEWLQS